MPAKPGQMYGLRLLTQAFRVGWTYGKWDCGHVRDAAQRALHKNGQLRRLLTL